MVTAYDFPSARAAEAAGVDIVLVGDSGAMTVLGYPSTVAVSADEMLMLTRAVRRGLRTPFLVADLPFGSYEESDEQAVAHRDAVRQGGRRRRGQARARQRDLGRARPSDRAGRDPGDGPRRPDAADLDRARRLPRPGPQRRQRRADRRGDAGATGGGLLRDRARGDSGRGHRGADAADRRAGDRHRRRARDRRPGAGVPRPARDPRGPGRPLRAALRRPAGRDGRRRRGLRGRRARAPLPGAGAQLLDRRSRACRASAPNFPL